MSAVFLKEWLVKSDGNEYMNFTANAMETLFEDVYAKLALTPTAEEAEQMHQQIVDAALARASDDGLQFCSTPPWVTAKESMEFRCAQWLAKRISKPKPQPTEPNRTSQNGESCGLQTKPQTEADHHALAAPQPQPHLTDHALGPILSFLVTHPSHTWVYVDTTAVHTWSYMGMTHPGISHTRIWTPRFHYTVLLQKRTSGRILGLKLPTVPCADVQCSCCRAHNREDWPSGCEHCVQGWVLSCVAKSWRSCLKTLAAASTKEVDAAVDAIEMQTREDIGLAHADVDAIEVD